MYATDRRRYGARRMRADSGGGAGSTERCPTAIVLVRDGSDRRRSSVRGARSASTPSPPVSSLSRPPRRPRPRPDDEDETTQAEADAVPSASSTPAPAAATPARNHPPLDPLAVPVIFTARCERCAMGRTCRYNECLAVVTGISSAISLVCLCIGLSTDSWLYTCERKQDEGSTNFTYINTTTGLWRKCVVNASIGTIAIKLPHCYRTSGVLSLLCRALWAKWAD